MSHDVTPDDPGPGEPLGSIDDPLRRVETWVGGARHAGVPQPEAMCLATASTSGVPTARMVLYKGLSGPGIRFFTNHESRKGVELAANPVAAVVLYWAPLHRQVRLEGRVEPLSDAESDAYFATRPRGSQIGAWASAQSRPVEDRADLERRIEEVEVRFPGPVPRPPHWGGYRLTPSVIEFWRGRRDRLHDRDRFDRTPGGGWAHRRLMP